VETEESWVLEETGETWDLEETEETLEAQPEIVEELEHRHMEAPFLQAVTLVRVVDAARRRLLRAGTDRAARWVGTLHQVSAEQDRTLR